MLLTLLLLLPSACVVITFIARLLFRQLLHINYTLWWCPYAYINSSLLLINAPSLPAFTSESQFNHHPNSDFNWFNMSPVGDRSPYPGRDNERWLPRSMQRMRLMMHFEMEIKPSQRRIFRVKVIQLGIFCARVRLYARRNFRFVRLKLCVRGRNNKFSSAGSEFSQWIIGDVVIFTRCF